MRALVWFILILIFVGAVAYAGYIYLQQNKDKFNKDSMPGKLAKAVTPTPPGEIKKTVHGPIDYNILEDQGGQPQAEAVAAGLVTDKWAYLTGLSAIQATVGVKKAHGVKVRGKTYDLCYQFNSEPPEEQYLEYNLEAKWDELHFGFGFDDSEPSEPSKEHAIELTVQVDGKPVFGPQRITPTDKPIFTMLPVKGANRVLFISKRIGTNNQFAPVLLDAFVKPASPPPPAPPLGSAPSAPAGS
jgi:hypothetical protein